MIVLVLLLATTMTSLSMAQNPFPQLAAAMAGGMGGGMGGGHPHPHPPPPPPGNGYPQVQSSHCRYLINAPSPWGINASPFKLYTRSYAGEVRRGYPVEVSILPLYDVFKSFNFTDFAIWSEPLNTGPKPQRREMEMQWGGGAAVPPPSPNTVSHVGVWQVFSQYARGAGSLKCNIHSRGEDTVGTFEGRMLELLKAQFPGDARLASFQPSARQGVAFLWYPDESAMNSGAIKFVAKLKSFGQWFHLESTSWKVYQPPPPPRPFSFNFNTNNMKTVMDRTVDMVQKLRQFERKLDRAGSPGA